MIEPAAERLNVVGAAVLPFSSTLGRFSLQSTAPVVVLVLLANSDE